MIWGNSTLIDCSASQMYLKGFKTDIWTRAHTAPNSYFMHTYEPKTLKTFHLLYKDSIIANL